MDGAVAAGPTPAACAGFFVAAHEEDAQGALRVRTTDRMHLVVSGEASVRLTPGLPGGTA